MAVVKLNIENCQVKFYQTACERTHSYEEDTGNVQWVKWCFLESPLDLQTGGLKPLLKVQEGQ